MKPKALAHTPFIDLLDTKKFFTADLLTQTFCVVVNGGYSLTDRVLYSNRSQRSYQLTQYLL